MVSLLLRYLKDYRLQMILVFVFVLSQAAAQLYLPTMMGDIIENGVAQGDTPYILKSGAMMLAVSLVAAVCMVASSYYSAYVTASFTSRIRADVFDKVKDFSQTDFNQFGAATLLTRSTTDATQMQIVVINGLRSLLLVPITGVGALVMAFRENITLTLLLLGSFLITTIIIGLTTARSMPLFKLMQQKVDRLNLLMKEKLTGVRTIRAFNRQDYETEKFGQANQEGMQAAVKANYAVAFFAPLMQLMMNLTMVIILWLGAQEVQQQIVTLGGLMVFIQYVLMFMSALGLVSALLMAYPQAAVSASRVKEVLDCDFSIQDKENPVILENIAGRIEFRAVSFGYSGAEINVLERLDFVAEPGKITAIVGATGSGKTTLVNLIMRLYEVSSGAIVIDGVDIRDLTQHDLRSIIAYAPQESVLFSGTVLENIRVGKDQATEAEVIEALSIAQALDFINEREGQVASTISQGGKDLSGGQRQRLSIARAAVKKAPITIFDDCFSALDFKTDSLVRKAIREKFGDKTVLIVAQRISTIKHADQILVLDNGAIVGQGKHEDLIRDCRVYQEILKSQSYSDGKEESL
ncbi:ABC transporter ATP-binding protein [Acetobacterium carbinolicum]|jgi:ATP-binding cassette subfamily B protein|uniref:ABC transporter ATP-binding protein n=1 Tax=Acetobacterium TaxID=33951 RepID=UPI000DBEB3B6|nr:MULTISPECIES: ABC transporter ATP-binding protein [unclassified Acetobacterium]AWW26509.1 ABC transporter ATP-binding protein [Acetobacterium sp. KB-1]MDK2942131.1 ATP-binding cassette, subfamily bacterial [Acetobacterium sp.]MDZ5724772.1 ABC transporter ATP-binding protein [Acetobacterium sp. K1/6]